MCIDASRRGVLHLWKCHGRANQRWTFTAQADGTLELVGLGGNCIGGAAPDNQLQITSCTSPASRYHFDGGRLAEAVSGECVTSASFNGGARIFLDRCSPENSAQLWTVAPLTQ
jgi:hypothetical protein